MLLGFSTLLDVDEAGPNYLYSLINDYDHFLQIFGGYIPLTKFISVWTCMSPDEFCSILPGDSLWWGTSAVVCTEGPEETSDGVIMITAKDKARGCESFITMGEVYKFPNAWHYTQKQYQEFVQISNEMRKNGTLAKQPLGKGIICQKPILITKTSPPLS